LGSRWKSHFKND